VPLTFSCRKNDNSDGENPWGFREGEIWYLFHGIWFLSCVITCSDCYPLSNQINLLMVINIWGIIIYFIFQLKYFCRKYVFFLSCNRQTNNELLTYPRDQEVDMIDILKLWAVSQLYYKCYINVYCNLGKRGWIIKGLHLIEIFSSYIGFSVVNFPFLNSNKHAPDQFIIK
jgi:hypothetical protein